MSTLSRLVLILNSLLHFDGWLPTQRYPNAATRHGHTGSTHTLTNNHTDHYSYFTCPRSHIKRRF